MVDDVRRGYVSVEGARNDYGVVLDESGAVDDEATQARRGAIRAERLS